MSRHLVGGFIVFVAALLGVACAGDRDGAADPPVPDAPPPTIARATPSVVVSADLTSPPQIIVPTDGPGPDALVTDDVVRGTGAIAEVGTSVSVRYVGVLWEGGDQFDSSWPRERELNFIIGAGRVIAGWDRGVEGMAVGGRRTLIIPAELAYGATGSPSGSIGPDEDLVFVVDLIAVYGPKPAVGIPSPLPDSLEIDDLRVGEGAIVRAGDLISVHYVGVAASTGEEFDASWDRGVEASFEIGTGQVIPGWDQGLVGMAVGGQRKLTVPPDLGYGATGRAPAIGPDETLVFIVDLLGLTPAES